MTSIYEEKPWLKFYPSEIPTEIEIPVKSVNEAFDEATERWGHKTAMLFYGKKITYRELREKVDRLAAALAHLGVRKGDRVALMLLNSPEYIISFYGCLKVGAILSPISPIYVHSEIKHQLEDCGAKTIICNDILYSGVEKTGLELDNVILTNISESLPFLKRVLGKSILRSVYEKMALPPSEIIEREGFHRLQDLIQSYPPDPPTIEIDPKEDLAVLPYTGGTTGPPKGVMLTHYNMVANDILYRAFYPFLEVGKEVIIGFMPFYHGGGQFFSVLDGIIQGSALVILTTPDTADILKATVRNKVSIFAGSPSLYEMLKDHEKTDRVNWKKLKILLSGADALHESTAKGWQSRSGVSLTEGYGMTEMVSISHSNLKGKERVGSIGIPLPNTMAAIVDPDNDEFVPVGEIGEIAIHGPQVTTKGYWGRPDVTKECEAMISGKRWWRTGDLGRMEREGYFYVYDRKRDLIKYKGLRVFAREVEEVLRSHPKIRQVGVIGVPDIKVGENVKALVVLEADARGKISEAEIMDYCRDKMAYYKVPRIVEFAQEIPLTDIGKVSRRELREEEA